jgi:hypothetical protein
MYVETDFSMYTSFITCVHHVLETTTKSFRKLPLGSSYIRIIIINLLMSPSLPYELHIMRTGHYPPHEPSGARGGRNWWVLTTTNSARTNGSTFLAKHVGDNKFLVTHPITDQRGLGPAITRRTH